MDQYRSKLWTIIYRSIGNIQNIPYLVFLKKTPTNSNLINFCQYWHDIPEAVTLRPYFCFDNSLHRCHKLQHMQANCIRSPERTAYDHQILLNELGSTNRYCESRIEYFPFRRTLRCFSSFTFYTHHMVHCFNDQMLVRTAHAHNHFHWKKHFRKVRSRSSWLWKAASSLVWRRAVMWTYAFRVV